MNTRIKHLINGIAAIGLAGHHIAALAQTDVLDEVVVTATRSVSTAETTPAAVSVVTSEDIASAKVSRLGDALEQVPSLYLRGGALGQSQGTQGTSGMSLRGVDQSRTLVLLDGQPLQDASSGKVNWRMPFIEDIERIEVVPGAFSALYGSNAIGGVINIISKRPDKHEFTGKVRRGTGDASGTDASLYYRDKSESGLGFTGGVGIQERDSYVNEFVVKQASCPPLPAPCTPGIPVTGAIPTNTRDGIPAYVVGDLGATPWRSVNASAKVFQEFGNHNLIYAGINHQQTDQHPTTFHSYLRDVAGATVNFGTLNINGQRVALSNYDFTLFSFLPLQERATQYVLGYEGQMSDLLIKADIAQINRGYRFTLASPTATWDSGTGTLSDTPNQALDANLQLSFPVESNHFVMTGIAMHQDSVDQKIYALTNWRDPASITTANSQYRGHSTTSSAFAQDEYALTDELKVYLGGRWDKWTTGGDNAILVGALASNVFAERSVSAFSPKISLVYQPVDTLTLRSSLGRSFRAPTNQDLYTSSTSRGRTTSGDPNLQPEKGVTLEFGGDWHPSATLRLGATLYSTELTDLIYLQQVSPTQSLRINAGKARINGIELTGSSHLTDWLTLNMNYAFVDSRMLANQADPLSVGKRLTDAPKNIGGISLSAKQGAWSGTLDVRYNSHVFWTAQNTDVIEGVPGSYDASTLTNVAIDYRFDKSVQGSLGINNLFDQKSYSYFLQPRRNLSAELRFTY